MTTFLLVIPVQTQGRPTSAEDSCFPVEAGAETLVCGGGMPESGDQEANSTSIEKWTTFRSPVDSCFPVEAGAETLVCGGGMPESGNQEANSTSIEDYPNIS